MLLGRRFAYALAVFVATFLFNALRPTWQGDFSYAFCEARALLNGSDPYAVCQLPYNGGIGASYPLTTALFTIAFVPFQPYGTALLFALSCGLLAFGLLRKGETWRLLLFLSNPFLQAFYWGQWSPLIAATYVLPNILPLALVKPNIAIPVLLTRLTRHRFAGLAAFGLLSLLFDPLWPIKWLHTTQTYDGFIPLLTLPLGPLLAVSLLKWRDSRALFFFLMALSPQRGYYDLLLLFLLPRTRYKMLFLVAVSWLVAWRYLAPSFMRVEFWLYPFALALLLAPRFQTMIPKLRAWLVAGTT